ncbi:aryl-alcohol dehydrogenase-like predicted oxidoreductase [Pullulanibacillus pueri]|uniref:Oxidoreductase n=1 Tax=Pullulanibacillus pueri TaxID=1437324 RepID=A0A8J3EMG1_9BACL|nr:aldo/keto reductase [Pullulanibacillus pueri]MBM7682633.1 aryl-alcohol dehydrogenase-like predicted oxidoreductase [Pullulanibacillus pueri]GGH82589.1 oxidoreductase [Pullulanibacillus pueri]
MQKRRLGQTEFEISPIGLGCIQFSQGSGFVGKFYSPMDQKTMNQVVKAAFNGGINWFDTAEKYGNGKSEEALSTALKQNNIMPGKAIVATKWYPVFRTAEHIKKSIDTRLQALQDYPIDLYQIHLPYSLSSISAQMQAMASLNQSRKIRSIGVSNFSAQQMLKAYETLKAQGLTLASNQVKISLLDRNIETNGVLNMARKLGVTLIAHSPLGSGILTGKFHENKDLINTLSPLRKMLGRYSSRKLERTAKLVSELTAIGQAHGISATQVALNWLITYYGETVVAIPGASKPHHAEANASAMSVRLTESELQRIDELSRRLMK